MLTTHLEWAIDSSSFAILQPQGVFSRELRGKLATGREYRSRCFSFEPSPQRQSFEHGRLRFGGVARLSVQVRCLWQNDCDGYRGRRNSDQRTEWPAVGCRVLHQRNEPERVIQPEQYPLQASAFVETKKVVFLWQEASYCMMGIQLIRFRQSSASVVSQMSISSSTTRARGMFCGTMRTPLLGSLAMNFAKCCGMVLRSCVTSSRPSCAAFVRTSTSFKASKFAAAAVLKSIVGSRRKRALTMF